MQTAKIITFVKTSSSEALGISPKNQKIVTLAIQIVNALNELNNTTVYNHPREKLERRLNSVGNN